MPARRTAVLVPGFRSRGAIRVFCDGWTERAQRFSPEAIAATLSQLDDLARTKICAVTHAVIVMERLGEARLSEIDRERLWSAFHVPIFEQIIGDDGRLLAAECEAHDGLHIESPDLPKELAGEIESSPCGCGRTTPRVVRIGYPCIHDSRCNHATVGV